jgi:hypothetical protein
MGGMVRATKAFMATGAGLGAFIEFTELGRFTVEALEAFLKVVGEDLRKGRAKNAHSGLLHSRKPV